MENQKRYDMKNSGVGKTGGGIFKDVLIDGTWRIIGDVDCIDFTMNGVGGVDGKLKADSAKIIGQGHIKGSLEADEFWVNGQATIDGDAEIKKIKIEGMASFKGNVNAEAVENHGVIKVVGDCSTENFISNGAFTIKGLLNADNIDIYMNAPCKAREIGGEQITVKMGNTSGFASVIKSLASVLDINVGLTTEVIEGDSIYLENTKAKIVRGDNVTIGPDCEIDLVEYKSKLEVSDKAIINQSKKL